MALHGDWLEEYVGDYCDIARIALTLIIDKGRVIWALRNAVHGQIGNGLNLVISTGNS